MQRNEYSQTSEKNQGLVSKTTSAEMGDYSFKYAVANGP